MKTKQKIGIIGGTFDPIHLGHTYIAEKCYRELGMDKIIFVPCKQSPHKLTKENAADHHRLEMCRLAVKSLPWAVVDDYELNIPPPSFSWRTAEVMQEKYPDAELHWLMGSDQWKSILLWDRSAYFASLVNFIVISRGDEPEQIAGYSFQHLSGAHTASATFIRNNPTSPQATAWLHPAVYSYICKHDVY